MASAFSGSVAAVVLTLVRRCQSPASGSGHRHGENTVGETKFATGSIHHRGRNLHQIELTLNCLGVGSRPRVATLTLDGTLTTRLFSSC